MMLRSMRLYPITLIAFFIVGLMVTFGSLQAASRALYQQDAPPPVIDGFSPDSGPPGTMVSITGSGFTSTESVDFNGVPGEFSVDSDNSISATVPEDATTGAITVSTANGSAFSPGSFTVIREDDQLPTVTGFTPDTGTAGTEVSITGTNLENVTAVTFNGTSAVFSEVSPTEISAIVPEGAETGPINVTTGAGSADSPGDFTVITDDGPPEIMGFDPDSGPVGTEVLISGGNFSSVTSVSFNGVDAAFDIADADIIAVVPEGATTGPITLTNFFGTGTSGGDFTVEEDGGGGELMIADFSPKIGPVGTSVTITGSGFVDITQVSFNGMAANFNVNSDIELTAEVPEGSTTGPISVINDTGMVSSNEDFTVVASSIQFSMARYMVGEGMDQALIQVDRSGDVSGRATVVYFTADGTAEAGTSYLPVNGRLVFEADETSKTFIVPILDDTLTTGDQTVMLFLDQVTDGASLGDPGTAVLTIKDNEAANAPILQVIQMIDFGTVELTQTKTVITEVRNGGSQPLNFSQPIIAAGASDGFFIATPPNSLSLKPNESAFFMVGYTPTRLNVNGITGSLLINSNGGNRTVTLTGRSIELTPPTVTITNPVGGENLIAGQPFVVRFTGSDNDVIAGYTLAYSLDGGANIAGEIARVNGNAREVIWNVPDSLRTTEGQIIVTAMDRSGNLGDASSGLFMIAPQTSTAASLQVIISFDPPVLGQLAPPQNVQISARELGSSRPPKSIKLAQLQLPPDQQTTNAELIGYNIYRVPEPPPDQPKPTPEQIVNDPQNLVGSISSSLTSFTNQVSSGQSNTGNFVYSVTSFFGNGQSSGGSQPQGTDLPVIKNPVFKKGSIFIDARSSFIQSGAMLIIDDNDKFMLKFDDSGTLLTVDKKAKSQTSNLTIKKLLKKGKTVRLTVLNPDGKLSVGVMFTRSKK